MGPMPPLSVLGIIDRLIECPQELGLHCFRVPFGKPVAGFNDCILHVQANVAGAKVKMI